MPFFFLALTGHRTVNPQMINALPAANFSLPAGHFGFLACISAGFLHLLSQCLHGFQAFLFNA